MQNRRGQNGIISYWDTNDARQWGFVLSFQQFVKLFAFAFALIALRVSSTLFYLVQTDQLRVVLMQKVAR
jgi:hypothetical protein